MSHLHIETPYLHSHKLSQLIGTEIWLKLDAVQPCGSFKARGMGATCQHFLNEGASAFVSSSGGNAGLAVAWAGRLLGVPVTVVVPESTKERPKQLIKEEGAEVIVHGESWVEAHALATDIAERNRAALLHPFENPITWSGHATMVTEMARQGPQPDLVILSVGGGGLLCGVAEGLEKVGWSDTQILAVETDGAASLHGSRLADQHIALEKITTIATTLGAKQVTEQAWRLVQAGNVYTVTVSDREAVNACRQFLDDHRLLVEPACGAALATLYSRRESLDRYPRIAVIVCGGAGISFDQLIEWEKQFAE